LKTKGKKGKGKGKDKENKRGRGGGVQRCQPPPSSQVWISSLDEPHLSGVKERKGRRKRKKGSPSVGEGGGPADTSRIGLHLRKPPNRVPRLSINVTQERKGKKEKKKNQRRKKKGGRGRKKKKEGNT